MTRFAIQADGLSKLYRLRSESSNTLRDVLAASLRSTFRRRPLPERERGDRLWALRDVSFDVKQGEIVGIIGRNGCGKSTLLKILARITRPTRGTAALHGRLGSLLEVGTGFHGELSGRENIYLSGTILGMRKDDIRRRFDEIVAFAEIEKFLDTAVKHYSSGMYVRLAFAVAAYLEPDILLVDEVLAVGDVAFQRKCLGKMQQVASAGRTVLFVSHDSAAITTLCERALLLHNGQLIKDGDARAVMDHYLDANNGLYSPIPYAVEDRAELRLQAIRCDQGGPTGTVDCRRAFDVVIDYDVMRPLSGVRLTLLLRNHRGEIIFGTSDCDEQGDDVDQRPPGRYRATVSFPAKLLKAGRIYITFIADIPRQRMLVAAADALQLNIVDLESDAFSERNRRPGSVAPILPWAQIALSASDDQVTERSRT